MKIFEFRHYTTTQLVQKYGEIIGRDLYYTGKFILNFGYPKDTIYASFDSDAEMLSWLKEQLTTISQKCTELMKEIPSI